MASWKVRHSRSSNKGLLKFIGANNDWQFPQEIPGPMASFRIEDVSRYGFLNRHSGYLQHISYTENEVNELGPDAEILSPAERRIRRIKNEDDKWDEEYYMYVRWSRKLTFKLSVLGLTLLTRRLLTNSLHGKTRIFALHKTLSSQRPKSSLCSIYLELNVRLCANSSHVISNFARDQFSPQQQKNANYTSPWSPSCFHTPMMREQRSMTQPPRALGLSVP